MPQRFGQASDYSQQFAYLAQQNQVRLEQAAERVDRRREEELAAEDELMFQKYQEGKVSGQDIIAYIEKRVRQTGYDKAQQRKWQAALVEYRNNVADETATAAYEQSGNIGAFINHWKQRLQGTKQGTPERTQITKILTQLREERDGKALTNGASKIMREIMRGKKSTKDLIEYYRDALQTGKFDADTKNRIRDTIAELQKKQRAEQYQTQSLAIDEKLARGEISPQQAASEKDALAGRFNLATLDPVGYAQLKGEIRLLNATPDPVEVQKWQNRLEAGKITPAQYAAQMDIWADQIAQFDQKSAWELRGQADALVRQYEEAQRLPGGGIIGQGDKPGSTEDGDRFGGAATVRNFVANRQKIAHITQLDGGTYSQINCTMASAAMLAHSLGVEGLTGSDLRALTGDTEGGTTLLQAKYALEQSGVNPSLMRYKDNYDYNKFVSNIKQGSTAMVSGYLGNMGGSGLNNGGQNYNHNIYVVKYHPQKGFLALDPAKSDDKGTWLSESQMRAFAWTGTGLGSYSRNGSVMFSPKGTLATRWNKGKTYDPRKNRSYQSRVSAARARAEQGKAGAAYGGEPFEPGIAHISVDAPAKTPAGQQYVGQFAAGVNTASITSATNALEASWQTPEHKARLKAAGIEFGDKGLDTRDEVAAAVADRTQNVGMLRAWLDGFAEQYDGSDGPVRVVVGSEVRFLNIDDISQLERDLVTALDGLSMLNFALGNTEAYVQAHKDIIGVLQTSQNLTLTESTWEQNRLIASGLTRLNNEDDPIKAREIAGEFADELRDWAEGQVEQAGYDPVSGKVTLPEGEQEVKTEQDEWLNALDDSPDSGLAQSILHVLDAIEAPGTTTEDLNALIGQLAEAFPEQVQMPGEDGPGVNIGSALLFLAEVEGSMKQVDADMGELVYMPDGTTKFVPYVGFPGSTASGERAEGVGTVAGAEGVDIVGTGAVPVLDLDYITTTLGIELPVETTLTGDGLPKVFIMQNGQLESVSVVPTTQAYGPQMLRVNADGIEKITQYFSSRSLPVPEGLVEGGYIDADMMGSFSPTVVANLLRGENPALVAEDYMVQTIRMPGTGITYFQDPETLIWHEDGLPHVGHTGVNLPGENPSTLINYMPSKVNEAGYPVPDTLGWLADSTASSGTVTPAHPDVPPDLALGAQLNGEGNPETNMRRDPLTGDLREPSEFDIYDQYAPNKSVIQAIEKASEAAKRGWQSFIDGVGAAVENATPSADGTPSGLPRSPENAMQNFLDSQQGGFQYQVPDLGMVGATDYGKQTEAPGIQPTNFMQRVMGADPSKWIQDTIGKASQSIQQASKDAKIPKVEWKPSSAEGFVKDSNLGYQKVEKGGYSWEGGSSYTPPKPEEESALPGGR